MGNKPTDIIGVVGAGQIGRSVAHAFAERSTVVLVDHDQKTLNQAIDAIRRAHFGRILQGKSAVRPETILANLAPTTELTDLRAANVVIENITEVPELKLDIHRVLARLATPGAVIATNTSAIPLSYLASAHSGRTERFLGLHFMIPVIEIRHLELIRARDTSESAVTAVQDVLDRHDLQTVVVSDGPGFVSNRLLMLLINEAAAVVREGTASATAVDAVLHNCMGHRLGPLATADLIGLDTVVRSLRVLQRFCDEKKFAPDPGLLELVEAGRLGHKTGSGFFDYATTTVGSHAKAEGAPAE